ncbi:MAG: inactive transglutaminase family protein [Oceanococcaceae bacterium]
MKNRKIVLLALLLCVIAVALLYAKVTQLGLPLTPDARSSVWTVEARASFESQGRVKATLTLPDRPPGFDILDEDFVVRDFGLAEDVVDGQRVALFSARQARGPQALYYRVSLNPRSAPHRDADQFPGYPPVPDYPELYAPAIETLLSSVRTRSADIASFTRQLILELRYNSRDPAVSLLRDEATTPFARAQQMVYILAGARIPARVVMGLELKHGVMNGALTPWLEVHNEQQWLFFNPTTGDLGRPLNLLVWQNHPGRLLTLEGARDSDVRFAIRRTESRTVELARELNQPLAQVSLLGLPLHVQTTYTVLLMVPFGALLVVFLRNIVGVRTFGTFMPVLIALAFRETELLWGCALFTIVVIVGLGLRFWLERLKLLLVPRLAAVLIMVILLMLLISIGSHRLGFERGLSIALFPMVILAMTIERMSIVWEEHGGKDATIQGLGSLLVAVMAFLVMQSPHLQHLVSLFPEVLLMLLALTLLLGRYTGYRLTEYWRFRSVWLSPPDTPRQP